MKFVAHFLVVAIIASGLSYVGIKIIESFRVVIQMNLGLPTPEGIEGAYSGVVYMRILVIVFWPLASTYIIEDIIDFLYN